VLLGKTCDLQVLYLFSTTFNHIDLFSYQKLFLNSMSEVFRLSNYCALYPLSLSCTKAGYRNSPSPKNLNFKSQVQYMKMFFMNGKLTIRSISIPASRGMSDGNFSVFRRSAYLLGSSALAVRPSSSRFTLNVLFRAGTPSRPVCTEMFALSRCTCPLVCCPFLVLLSSANTWCA